MSSPSQPPASSTDRIRIKVRSGQAEAEIEAEAGRIREAIELIPEVVSRLPSQRVDPPRQEPVFREPTSAAQSGTTAPDAFAPAQQPGITVEKGDSLSDIITKFFADPWGKSPRKLSEVREALQSYGLNYPKQSVAVALLRLAKSSRIRRFKSVGGEYVYTASTSMVTSQAQVLVLQDSGGIGEASEPATSENV
ncbi:MAG: hypothetical protein OK456_03050 [Thaumarchaeota archaeon]|nr:hypothetical protein [Nitrososphaerota archaeon]